MNRLGKISDRINFVQNNDTIELNIEGVIGIPAAWQFDKPEDYVLTKEEISKELQGFSDLVANGFSKIKLFINSPGGSVDHAVAMKRALEKTGADIYVEYTGNSASAATILATAASKKENISMPAYMDLLVHESRVQQSEAKTAQDFAFMAETLQKTNLNIAQMYSDFNGMTVEKNMELISRNNGEGTLLSAKEALYLGFIGQIIENKKVTQTIDMPLLLNCGWNESQINNLTQNKMNLFSKKKGDLNTEIVANGKKYIIVNNEVTEVLDVIEEKKEEVEAVNTPAETPENVEIEVEPATETNDVSSRLDNIETVITEALAKVDERFAKIEQAMGMISSLKKPEKAEIKEPVKIQKTARELSRERQRENKKNY